MNKTLVYVAILAILGFGIYFFIFRSNDNPYGSKEAGFNMKDTASVGKIFIAANDGQSITVERKEGMWLLNGKYKALPSMVQLVLNTLASQVAVTPVTKAAYNPAVKLLSTDATKVEVYKKDGSVMGIFYVGGAAANGIGTNMLMNGATTPYVVQIPAFTGDLTTHYSTRFRDWRDRTVFDVPGNNIKSVSLQYFDKPINSFILSKENGGFVLKGDTVITGAYGPLNTNRAIFYMNYFTNVNCEGYLNGLEGVDSSLKNTVKRCAIDLELTSGPKQHVDIYWMPVNKRSKNKLTANDDIPDDYDADRMYATINDNKDTVLIQAQAFQKILRMSYEFFQKDEVHRQVGPTPKNVVVKNNKLQQK